MPLNLDRLFHPRSVAIIGASRTAGSISAQPLHNLKAGGYAGRLYPVNPNHAEVHGERSYPSVGDLPETPDLALILVSAQRVPAALEACGAKGIPFALIVSSGFAEADSGGRCAQQEIVDIAKRHHLGVIGPNCQGLMNIPEGLAAGFGAPFTLRYRVGHVSVISQSGGLGGAIMMMAQEEGVGFRYFVTTGNECGISTLDLIESFCADPRTRVIAAYVECFKDARRLLEVGRGAMKAGKPLLVWKVGTSEPGSRAVASHTANLAGSATVYRAAFRQIGAIEVSDVADLADCARAFAPGRLPRGDRVAVITTSGGAGIVMADRYSEAGMRIPALAPESLARLRPLLPAFAALGNPIDTTAGIIDEPGRLREALSIIAADPNIDCMSLACAALTGEIGLRIAEAVLAVYRETDKPFFLAWNAPEETAREAYAMIDREGVPRFRTPGRCARAMSVLCEYAGAIAREAAREAEPPLTIDRPAMRAALRARRGSLAEFEAKRLLAEYGIPVTREELVARPEDAQRVAAAIGYPLAMKIQSSDIPHKTEIGGVQLGVGDAQAVSTAWTAIVENVRRHAPQASVDGILLQEQVAGATEVIVGVNNDILFGPAVMVGLGGIFAEVLNDVSVRLAPVTHAEALAMVRELRAFPILDGARGRPKADIRALADAIARVSALAMDLRDELVELDINPMFVFAEGAGVKAGDALIRTVDHPNA